MAVELTRPLAVIDYAPRDTPEWRLGNDCGVLLVCAGLLALLGIGVIAGVVAGVMAVWPMVGLALVVAVPIALVGLALLALAWTAVCSAFSTDLIAQCPGPLATRSD